jgi:acid phosphatase family membrane protein YuiD
MINDISEELSELHPQKVKIKPSSLRERLGHTIVEVII